MITRRGFIQGLAAAAVAANIPPEWLPTAGLKGETALEYLRRAYNRESEAHGVSPQIILVGRDLYDKVEGELAKLHRMVVWTPPAYVCVYCRRPSPGSQCQGCGAHQGVIDGWRQGLMFKGTALRLSGKPGWSYTMQFKSHSL